MHKIQLGNIKHVTERFNEIYMRELTRIDNNFYLHIDYCMTLTNKLYFCDNMYEREHSSCECIAVGYRKAFYLTNLVY